MTVNEERFQKAMNQGHSAAWDQMWERAAGYYMQALEEYPDHPKALTSLGLALYEMREYQQALQYYQRAANVSQDDPMPLEKVAELNERLGNIQEAAQSLMKAAELSAKNRDLNKAIESWSRVTLLNPDHMQAHSRLALVYERMGNKQQAAAEYILLAGLLQHRGELSKAVQTLTHALQLTPDSQDVASALQMVQTGQLLPKPIRARGATGPLMMAQVRRLEPPKESNAAEPSFDPIAEARQKALTVLAGLLFEQKGEETETHTERRGLGAIVKGKEPGSSKNIDQTKILLHLTQTVDLQARGKTAEAIEELDRAVDLGLDAPAAYFDLGLLMTEAGRMESALRHLQRAVKNPDFALGARLLTGKMLNEMGRTKEACVEYLEALRIADGLIVPEELSEELQQLYDPLIEAQSQQDDPESQARLCADVVELLVRSDWRQHLKDARQQLPVVDRDGPPAPLAEILTEARGSRVVEAITRIHQYARMGLKRAAMEEAFYALQHAPTYLPLHTYIGELLIQQNRTQPAVDKFMVVANSYSVRGESRRAVEMFRRIIELSPMDLQVRNRLIEQLTAVGRLEEAIKEYMNLSDTYYNMADLANARKTYTQALRVAQQVNVDRQWKTKILHRMADIDLQSLDWRQAMRVYEQIRTLQPDDEKARSSLIDINFRLNQAAQALAELDNYISYLWSNGEKKQAVQYLERLVDEHPRQPGIHRRLADLYRQMGRVPDAIEQLDTAGELMVEAGDKAGAVEAIQVILSLKPPNAADYQRLLAQVKGT